MPEKVVQLTCTVSVLAWDRKSVKVAVLLALVSAGLMSLMLIWGDGFTVVDAVRVSSLGSGSISPDSAVKLVTAVPAAVARTTSCWSSGTPVAEIDPKLQVTVFWGGSSGSQLGFWEST